MSLVLSWETPPDLYDLKLHALRVVVERGPRYTTLAESATWGVFEDEENNDPGTRYRVRYVNCNGANQTIIDSCDIRKWVRPDDSCKISLCFRRPDTSPWIGRRVKLVESPMSRFVRDLYANMDGQVIAIVGWDWRMRLEAEGWPKLLEFVVPRKRDATIEDLIAAGTWNELRS